jgi:Skp family chaperone for outer membrane proteins
VTVARETGDAPPGRAHPKRPPAGAAPPERAPVEVAAPDLPPPAIARADRPAPDPAPLDRRTVQRLQGAAGNAAVSRLMVQRLRASPGADPKFTALRHDVRAKQQRMSAHRPAKSEAGAAQSAAKPPQDDKLAQAKVAQSGDMATARPGGFDKAAFVKAVNEAIAAQAPKNLDEADKFGSSGKADAVKQQVAGQVGEGKKQSAAAISDATAAAPDQSRAVEKPVTPLAPDQPPPTPGAPDPANAVPDKAPPGATDFSAGPKQVDGELAAAQVTEPQLAKSNEPEFTGALTAKKAGEQHAATAPPALHAHETTTLAGAKQHAAAQGTAAMTALSGQRHAAGTAVGEGKQTAKGSDEAKRAEATSRLQKVFDTCKHEVEAILTGLDKKVDEQFTREEKAARDAFTADYSRRMKAYKDKRYSGFWGPGRWLKDKFAGLPDEVNAFYAEARAGYVTRMQGVISTVADTIGTELGRAKQRIATGRTELQAEVARLPKDLQSVGQQAARGFTAKFDELTSSVDAKGQELIQTLASKYTEALHAVDDQIAAEKEKNKGLVAKAMDAVGGVIKTILQLKDMLLGVLAKAASAVMAIIKDPIGFLGHLVSAVGAGLHAFLSNIGEHLKKGLLGWLLGAMSSAGLTLPAKFDLRGIITMVGSLLGLTWGAIRGRIVKRGVPDQAVTAAEKAEPLAEKLQSEGVAGIWQTIAAKVGDLKANLFGKIAQYLIPTVLIAGITWIISLLNPASAFIKACKMIIDIVTFIVERGAQIIQFVNAVLDAIIAIAGGSAGGVPGIIEKALAASIPVLIGALAAILGISGMAEKIKKFFQSLSKPIMKAVDWVVDKIVKAAKKLWAKLKSKFGRSGKKTDGKDGNLKPAVVNFHMRGEPHRLIFRPPATLLMASGAPEQIHAKASETLRAVQKIPSTPPYQKMLLEQIVKNSGDIVELKSAGFTQEDLVQEVRDLASLCETYGAAFKMTDIDPAGEELPDLPPQTELSADRTVLKTQKGQRVTNPVATSIAKALGYQRVGIGKGIILRNRSANPPYISPDEGSGGTTDGSHTGGIFKGAMTEDGFGPTQRTGTYAVKVKVEDKTLTYLGLHYVAE